VPKKSGKKVSGFSSPASLHSKDLDRRGQSAQHSRLKRNPTLMEALDASIAKEKAKFPLGVIVARNHADRAALKLEKNPAERPLSFPHVDQLDEWHRNVQKAREATYFVVIDSHWDADYCYLWVELMGLGDPSVRGWLRNPETKLMQVDLEKKRTRPCKTR